MGGWRNERMRERGSGTGNMGEDGLPRGGAPGSRGPQPLDPRTVALVQVAAAVPDVCSSDLLLQSLLVVGYPLALVAFGVWREITGPASAQGDGGGSGGGDGEELAHADWEAWAKRGAAVCAAVYGRAYHKLLLNLRGLHPALEDLVLVDAYGKVIGRPGLDLKRRELCTVAEIAVLGTAQQLHSHLRGALNTGATRAEVEGVLALIDGDLDAERRRSAREQWEDVR